MCHSPTDAAPKFLWKLEICQSLFRGLASSQRQTATRKWVLTLSVHIERPDNSICGTIAKTINVVPLSVIGVLAMMTEKARKTSVKSKHLPNYDYFAIIPSCSYFTMLTKNPSTGLV